MDVQSHAAIGALGPSVLTQSSNAAFATYGTHATSSVKEQFPRFPGLNLTRRMTTDLIKTYKQVCNGFHYETHLNPRRNLTKPAEPSSNNGYDNENSDYILRVNDAITAPDGDTYVVLDLLGAGTFGQVVRCQHTRTRQMRAVKVVKNKPAYFNQALVEVKILQLLNRQADPEDRHHIVVMLDYFVFRSHLCIVFEELSVNLYELLKQNSFRGLSTNLVRVIATQILDGLAVLYDTNIIHCDLKPENILLKNLTSSQIKLIDFGSACFEHHTVYSYIQSRFYRSPEVLLGLPNYSSMIDIWSFGCICMELFLGLPLFPGNSEYNQVQRIVDLLGMPSSSMIERSRNGRKFFSRVTVTPPSMANSPPATAAPVTTPVLSPPSSTVSDGPGGSVTGGVPSYLSISLSLASGSSSSSSPATASTALSPLEDGMTNGQHGTGAAGYRLKTMEEFSKEFNVDLQPSKQYFQFESLELLITKYPYKKGLAQKEIEKEQLQRRSFAHFMGGLLALHPLQRWTPRQALAHPFITGDPFDPSWTPPLDAKRNLFVPPEPVMPPLASSLPVQYQIPHMNHHTMPMPPPPQFGFPFMPNSGHIPGMFDALNLQGGPYRSDRGVAGGFGHTMYSVSPPSSWVKPHSYSGHEGMLSQHRMNMQGFNNHRLPHQFDPQNNPNNNNNSSHNVFVQNNFRQHRADHESDHRRDRSGERDRRPRKRSLGHISPQNMIRNSNQQTSKSTSPHNPSSQQNQSATAPRARRSRNTPPPSPPSNGSTSSQNTGRNGSRRGGRNGHRRNRSWGSTQEFASDMQMTPQLVHNLNQHSNSYNYNNHYMNMNMNSGVGIGMPPGSIPNRLTPPYPNVYSSHHSGSPASTMMHSNVSQDTTVSSSSVTADWDPFYDELLAQDGGDSGTNVGSVQCPPQGFMGSVNNHYNNNNEQSSPSTWAGDRKTAQSQRLRHDVASLSNQMSSMTFVNQSTPDSLPNQFANQSSNRTRRLSPPHAFSNFASSSFSDSYKTGRQPIKAYANGLGSMGAFPTAGDSYPDSGPRQVSTTNQPQLNRRPRVTPPASPPQSQSQFGYVMNQFHSDSAPGTSSAGGVIGNGCGSSYTGLPTLNGFPAEAHECEEYNTVYGFSPTGDMKTGKPFVSKDRNFRSGDGYTPKHIKPHRHKPP